MFAALVCLLIFADGARAAGAETWSEIRSPHFTIWSNAGDGAGRSVAWQLEQIRSAIAALYPWAKVDITQQLLVFAVKDENSIKALAPEFWERKGGVRPVSVWVSGSDRHYIIVRADLRGDDRDLLNPHTATYFSLANLILQSSFERRLPLWFSRGLAGVLSNTIVREDAILLGPPIPWHLQELRDSRRFPLKQLLSIARESPEFNGEINMRRFDAQSWAFVHFLMFADNGAHRSKVNRLATAINAGKDADAAFVEALGRPEDYEVPFVNYINRNLFGYQKARADAAVKKERFALRPIPPAEAVAGRALVHVAMRRPTEAAALVAEARALDPNAADAYVAEALSLELAGRHDDAKAAYAKAAQLGTSNAYALYRSAVLRWPDPDEATLRQMEKDLARAIELSPSFAPGHSALADVRVALKQPWTSILPLLNRALTLDPSNPWHKLSAARALHAYGNTAEALKLARAALAASGDGPPRGQAERLIAQLTAK